MWKDFKVIDADAHMHEPHYLWERYMEPEYRDQVPKVVGMNGINFIYEPDGKFIPHGKGRTGHPFFSLRGHGGEVRRGHATVVVAGNSPQRDGQVWLGHTGDSAHGQQRQLRR